MKLEEKILVRGGLRTKYFSEELENLTQDDVASTIKNLAVELEVLRLIYKGLRYSRYTQEELDRMEEVLGI